MARRIQRQRTKGWRMPEGAVYVGRPTRWGNPFAIGSLLGLSGYDHADRWQEVHIGAASAGQVVEAYRAWLTRWGGIPGLDPSILRGHDLACWCPLDQPCHADVLLELANRQA